MVDITKDEFWENKYEEVITKEKKNNKIKEFVLRHKIITTLLVTLSILITANVILIYNFFKILANM